MSSNNSIPAAETNRLIVVLVSTRNALNIGAAARAMSNFGLSTLRVVNPYEAGFREARSAVGAADLLREAKPYKNLGDAVADCHLVVGTTAARGRQLAQPLRSLPQAGPLIRRRLGAKNRVALLFGSEKRGLSNDDLSHCHWLLRIPTREEHGSMNLGQAVAVCLYEVARTGTRLKTTQRTSPANTGDMEAITSRLLDALNLSGYIHAKAQSSAEEKIRRLVRRLNIVETDADVWMGILRQILWKLRRNLE